MFRFVSCLLAFSTLINAQHVILNSNQGQLKGTIERSRGGRQFVAFYGIPYAKPPLVQLRFENPVPPEPWKGIRDCTSPRSACLSYEGGNNFYGDEDCLYLNLYTPQLVSKSRLPVVVFVHGGRYMFGNALPERYGPHYYMDKDVILITFNYRLGVLGFLSSGDKLLPGNYGLKDFAAVLRWVHENVHSFNGDKNKVTIAGGSSGGATTTYALMSPLTKGLFHRCISQSVPPDSIIPSQIARQRAFQMAAEVGCVGPTKESLLNCLKRVPARSLVKKNFSFNILGSFIPLYPFGPVIEDEQSPDPFLVDTAEKMLSRNTDIPWLAGMNSDEGGMTAIFTFFGDEIADDMSSDYDVYFPLLFLLANDPLEAAKFQKAAQLLKDHFFGDGDVEDHPLKFSKMIDLLYLKPLRDYFQLYRGPKYAYYYEHKNKESFSSFYGNPRPDLDFGVIHGDELISMFNWSEAIIPVTKGTDLIVSEQMLELWTNFATFGDPNGLGEKIWRPCNSSRIEHLHITSSGLKMRDELRKQDYDFLDKLYTLVDQLK